VPAGRVSKAVLAAGARVFSQVSSAIAVCRNNVAPDATEVAWPEWLMCLVRLAGRWLRGTVSPGADGVRGVLAGWKRQQRTRFLSDGGPADGA
jgi:hypothetical protein